MADSEVRQKEWTILETERLIRKIEQCEGMPAKLILMRHFFEAGMRAGEIAMREKALKAVADDLPCDCGFEENPVHYKYSSESGHAMNCNQYAALEAIRALPAAPEEK